MWNATPLLRAYARYRLNRLATLDPVECQRRVLESLLGQARDTRFGRDHGLAEIHDVAGYQKRVPLRRYEDFWRDYWQPSFPVIQGATWSGTVPYFAVTSGTTTGRSKYIPVTRAMLRANAKAGADLYAFHLRATPGSRLMAGRSFMLGGSTRLVEEAPGVASGDLSGITVAEMPWYARHRYFPPTELALLDDWEEKIALLAERSLDADIRMIGGVPSWLLLFFEQALAVGGGRSLANLYPNLELIVHGGVSFEPYKERFTQLFSGSQVDLRECYPASEGFIGVADGTPDDGLRLCLDHGQFFEFVPVAELDSPNPTRHWVRDVVADVDYAVIVTTCAGLWSYILGDTVRFVDDKPHRVVVTGRTTQMLSAFGEHVIVAELDHAIAEAAKATGAAVTDYAVGAVFPDATNARGRHRVVVEFASAAGPAEVSDFARLFDATLMNGNDDYRAHRAEGFGLDAPEVLVAPPGAFAEWMKARGKLGGQNKVPRVITSPNLLSDLVAFIHAIPPK